MPGIELVDYKRMDIVIVGVFLAVLLAALTQSLTGFGSGLVTMALLPGLIGIRSASPLVALLGGTLEGILFFRYRGAVDLSAVWRLSVAALVGIPLGIAGVRLIDERIVLTLLGLVLIGYPLYVFCTPTLPQVKEGGLTFGVGFVAGILGGAYNVSGPPVIIYGNSRGWTPPQFKANLQTFFMLNDVLTISSHAASGNLTPFVWQNYVLIIPAIALGLAGGLALDRWLDPARFRKLVLVLLMVLGVRMLASAVLS